MEGLSGHRVNWSKIDFNRWERDGHADVDRLESFCEPFATYCGRLAREGATAVALDDLAHLTPHPSHSASLQKKLRVYEGFYRRWFETAKAAGLEVYLNTDVMFYTPELSPLIGRGVREVARFLRDACDRLFQRYPVIRGIFFRLGECDGHDVRGDFHSALVIRTPARANDLLRELLPVFEKHGRRLILRTWTVGAYPIGDLIWNPKTFDRVTRGIQSPALVLSMKYGESDFFRHLRLNRLFFHNDIPKLIELQTKREYEGSGEYPSFTGYDYERFLRELSGARGLIGAHIWCQSGGWTVFRRLTYLQPEGIWNEINTSVTLRMCREGKPVEEAVADWARENRPGLQVEQLLELLRRSDEVIRTLLYVDDFAAQPIYFRRARIPPQLMVYWDHVFVNHTLRKVLRCFVRDPVAKQRQARAALESIDRMCELAAACGLPVDDIRFMRDTFEILAAARAYALLPHDPAHIETLQELKTSYKAAWRHRCRYAVKLDFERQRLARARLALIMRVVFRQTRDYRLLDKMVTVWLLGKLYPLLRLGGRRFFTGFADKQAMGIGTVFR